MKVKDLIKELEKLDQDKEILTKESYASNLASDTVIIEKCKYQCLDVEYGEYETYIKDEYGSSDWEQILNENILADGYRIY